MSLYTLDMTASAVEVLLGIALLFFLIRSKQVQMYWPMLVLALWQTVPFGALILIRRYGRAYNIPARTAYDFYYYTYWSCFALEAVAAIALTYTILHGAMAPLQGLQKLVKIVYFWAAGISLLIAADVAFTPAQDVRQLTQLSVITFQRGTGIITVSLAIFVCLAIRPMGLSFRNRVFGTSFGLVLVSVTNVFIANYLQQSRPMNGPHSLIQIGVGCISQGIWIYYFATPEPERQFLLMDMTSPFHRWNMIAQQFGQSAGVVAIGGIKPEMFASAELEVFHRTSAKTRELELKDDGTALPGPS